MRKVIMVAVLAVGLSGISGMSYAQSENKMEMKKDGDMKMCPLKGKMMGYKKMGGPSMVASSDGGVFVMKGCKITKFDKNLNAVKEVTLDCDGKQLCPMCQMMMKDGNTDDVSETGGEESAK